jgi:hypothetical protein
LTAKPTREWVASTFQVPVGAIVDVLMGASVKWVILLASATIAK